MHANFGLQLTGRARYDFTHTTLPELLGRGVPASPATSPPAASPSGAPLCGSGDVPPTARVGQRSDDDDAAPPLKQSKGGGGAAGHDRGAKGSGMDAAKVKPKKSKNKTRDKDAGSKRRRREGSGGGEPDGVVVPHTVPVDTLGPPKVAEGPPAVALSNAAGPPKVALGCLDDDSALAAPEPAWAEAVALPVQEDEKDAVLEDARAVLDRGINAATARRLHSEASFDPWDVSPAAEAAARTTQAERDQVEAAAPGWAARAHAATGRPHEAEAVDESWFAEFLEGSPSPEEAGGAQMTRGEYQRQFAVYVRLRQVIGEALQRFRACQRAVAGAADGSARLAAAAELDGEVVRRAAHVERCEQALSTLQARLERVQESVMQR